MPDDNQTTNNPTDDQTQVLVGDSKAQAVAQDAIADELMNQDIFKVLKLDHLSQEEKDKLQEKMVNTIQGRIMARIMDVLSAEDQKKLNELFDKNDDKEIEEFLKNKTDMQNIVVQEILLYKAEMIDNSQQIDKMVQKPTQGAASSVEESEEEPTTAVV